MVGRTCEFEGEELMLGGVVPRSEGEDGEEVLDGVGAVALTAADLMPKPRKRSASQAKLEC